MFLFFCCVLFWGDSSFVFDAELLPEGTVYHYRKSNIDGSRAGNVALYVAGDRLEAAKWSDPSHGLTLIVAEMDWPRFSVRRFDNYLLTADGNRLHRGWLAVTGNTARFSFGPIEGETEIASFPWHSYDFDFNSLSQSFRFLRDPKSDFRFTIADAVPRGDSFTFGNVGEVSVTYLGEDNREGRACDRYRVDGPGLDHRGGTIWVDQETRVIADLEIAKPDEEGYDSNKMKLLRVDKMSPEAWNAFLEQVIR